MLLYPLKKESQIKIYPAITIELVNDYSEQILSQNEDYAFIPLNVAYNENVTQRKNHWAGLIIDKKHQLIFYLDPARKLISPQTEEGLKKIFSFQNNVIHNPINFQKEEKQEEWIRHCGVYVVEIFSVFGKYIQSGTCISGSYFADMNIDKDSISLQTVLSEIPCGEAGIIPKTRKVHIEKALEISEDNFKENPLEFQNVQPQQQIVSSHFFPVSSFEVTLGNLKLFIKTFSHEYTFQVSRKDTTVALEILSQKVEKIDLNTLLKTNLQGLISFVEEIKKLNITANVIVQDNMITVDTISVEAAMSLEGKLRDTVLSSVQEKVESQSKIIHGFSEK